MLGVGDVCFVGSNGTTFWLKNVRYVPGLSQNLFSVAAAIEDGMRFGVSSHGEYTVLRRERVALCPIEKCGKQYLLGTTALETDDVRVYRVVLREEGKGLQHFAYVASPVSKDNLELWHRRLAHPAYDTVKKMAAEGLVTGIRLPPSLLKKKAPMCECCVLSKQPHLPHPRSASTTDRPLELIHADISGPFEYVSNGGHF